MAQDEKEWLEQHAQRLLNSQKSEADAAKLLTTFVAAIAATLVATALQVGARPSVPDYWAVSLLGLSIVTTILSIVFDRLKCPDHAQILGNATLGGWTSARLLEELRTAELTTVAFNKDVLFHIKVFVMAQIFLASASGIAAAISLLAEATSGAP